jgi:hypothetical protein
MNKTVFLVSACLASLAIAVPTLADGDPSLHQVYEAANAGRLAEAQGMMTQVLKDHPNSAKAHFVEAEILAKQGQLANARAELNTAEQLAPGLPFAKPDSIVSLKHHISGNHAPTQMASGSYVAQPQSSSGISWPMLLVGLGLVVAIIMFVRSLRQRNNALYSYAGGTAYGPGYGSSAPMPYGGGGFAQPMGPGPVAGGMGSGILGGLATGAAVGAGMVAGEALMHHFTDGPRQDLGQVPLQSSSDTWDSAPDDMGGNDFGISDGSSWDDSSSGGDW